jgi:hypothetical protein
MWGNHVSDWEHVTVRLNTSLVPDSVYFSMHDTGQAVAWPAAEKIDSHPIVYSAWGSHGIWPAAGQHVYKDLSILGKLADDCSTGTAWDTWNRLETYDYAAKVGLGMSQWPRWMGTDYTTAGTNPADPAAGPIYRWGNPKDGCFGEVISGPPHCRGD